MNANEIGGRIRLPRRAPSFAGLLRERLGALVWGTTLTRNYHQDTGIAGTPARRKGLAVLAVVLVVYPIVESTFWIDLANQVAIASMGAIALTMLLGVAGQLSLGSAAFMGVGGFTAAVFAVQELQLPFLLVLVLGALAGAVVALILGLIALRIRGFYLVLATIALVYIVAFLFMQYQNHTAGPGGFIMPPARIGGWSPVDPQSWYPLLVVIAVVTTILASNLRRSRSGRAWSAIKDRDIAAAILGVNVTKMKLLVFVVTSVVIGVEGVLYAYYVGVVTNETYTVDLSVQYVAMIVIGGLGSIPGAILGAVYVTAIPYVVRNIVDALPSWFPGYDSITNSTFSIQLVIYGLSIIAFMRIAPNGLIELVRRIARPWRSFPFAHDQDLDVGSPVTLR